MSDVERQIEALDALHSIYLDALGAVEGGWGMVDFDRPRKTDDARWDDWHWDHRRHVRALLDAGYPVPDAWLFADPQRVKPSSDIAQAMLGELVRLKARRNRTADVPLEVTLMDLCWLSAGAVKVKTLQNNPKPSPMGKQGKSKTYSYRHYVAEFWRWGNMPSEGEAREQLVRRPKCPTGKDSPFRFP